VGRHGRLRLKGLVWVLCLFPLAFLLVWAGRGDLTANPISFITNWLGDWALRILLVSLALTPLRLITGLAWQMPLRRLLGLFAFFYVSLHFSVWLALDHFFDWHQMGADIVKRPYITAGMAALLCLIPLAATSTTGMIKRLGAPAWRRLHRLAYGAGLLASVHFLWLAKVGRVEQYVYAGTLAMLLGVRLWYAGRRFMRSRMTHVPEPS
jgi:methionine sulfoxide reductase heme-binding subunit